MTSELTVNVQPDSIQIAITEDHNLVEYQKDAQEVSFAVGNLYLGPKSNCATAPASCSTTNTATPASRCCQT